MTVAPKLDFTEVSSKLKRLKDNLSQVIRGKTEEIDYLLMSVLTGESILVEDVPGVGKTTLAKALAASLDLEFRRIQCTPDLLPTDVFGVSIFNPNEGSFHFRKGPIFCDVLLVDEINRASPRTQSALLEAMAERQVTVEGVTYPLNRPFQVIATQNPFGFRGTFPLPESQLDRFSMQISMNYPDLDTELQILYRESGGSGLSNIEPVLQREEITGLQDQLDEIGFEESIARYLMEMVTQTREDPRIELGCSPRGAISFFKAAKASAMIDGRPNVLPDDVKRVAPHVLRHRIVPVSRQAGDSVEKIISELLERASVPV